MNNTGLKLDTDAGLTFAKNNEMAGNCVATRQLRGLGTLMENLNMKQVVRFCIISLPVNEII